MEVTGSNSNTKQFYTNYIILMSKCCPSAGQALWSQIAITIWLFVCVCGACVWEQHRAVSQSLDAHSAVLLQLLPNLIYFHSQFVSSYPEEKLDVTAAREPPLKQSTSMATKAALPAALRVCRLAVAAGFSFQHYNTARLVTGNTQRASKFKTWWIKNNLGIIIALGVY